MNLDPHFGAEFIDLTNVNFTSELLHALPVEVARAGWIIAIGAFIIEMLTPN